MPDVLFRSVSPSSGPVEGGTSVVITGVDLGGDSDHVVVKIGNSTCQNERYSTGK